MDDNFLAQLKAMNFCVKTERFFIVYKMVEATNENGSLWSNNSVSEDDTNRDLTTINSVMEKI